MNSATRLRFTEIASELGVEELQQVNDYPEYLARQNTSKFDRLAQFYCSMSEEECASIIDEINGTHADACDNSSFRAIWYTLLLCELLNERDIAPFTDGKLHRFPSCPADVEWNELPAEFHYLIPYAERYGTVQFEDQIDCFRRRITRVEKFDLSIVGERVNDDLHQLVAWILQRSIVKSPAARLIHFLLTLLGELKLI